MNGLRALPLCPLLVALTACGTGQAVKARTATGSTPLAPGPVSPSIRAPSATPLKAQVTDETQNRLLVVDLPGGRVARRVPLPVDPETITSSGDAGVVIVVSSGAGKVTVLDPRTLRTIKTFGGFDQPHIAAVSPDGQYAYVTDDTRGTLTAIRLSDMKVTRTLQVGSGAHHLAFSPDEGRIWVALGQAARTITIVSTVVAMPPTPSSPVVDVGKPYVIGHFSPGFPAHDLAFSPDGRQVWVSSAAGREVTVFDARSRRALFRVPVGPGPQHLAFDGHYAYVTSGYGGTIEKVDAATGRVITRAIAPYGSFELDVADGYVATASLLRGTLAVYTPGLKLLRVVKLAPATREVAISRS